MKGTIYSQVSWVYYLDEWPVLAVSQVDACTWTSVYQISNFCERHLHKWHMPALSQVVSQTDLLHGNKKFNKACNHAFPEMKHTRESHVENSVASAYEFMKDLGLFP